MDPTLTTKINSLTVEYFSTGKASLLEKIEFLLKLQEYQSWKLKYVLKLIEHPNKFNKVSEINYFKSYFNYDNAYSKYHLIIPLLIHLFANYNSVHPALETSLSFMQASSANLLPGDFAKTKTGNQRFITNTRFASLELRNLGFLRSDRAYFYKSWQLSLFGVLVAGRIYTDLKKDKLTIPSFQHYKWYEAKQSSYYVLFEFIAKVQDSKETLNFFNSLFQEETITAHLNLFNQSFIHFAKHILQVIKEGYNPRKNSTKELLTFLEKINSNTELSKLADAIKLRKDIAVNLSAVYNIINPNPKNR